MLLLLTGIFLLIVLYLLSFKKENLFYTDYTLENTPEIHNKYYPTLIGVPGVCN